MPRRERPDTRKRDNKRKETIKTNTFAFSKARNVRAFAISQLAKVGLVSRVGVARWTLSLGALASAARLSELASRQKNARFAESKPRNRYFVGESAEARKCGSTVV